MSDTEGNDISWTSYVVEVMGWIMFSQNSCVEALNSSTLEYDYTEQ